MRSFLSYNQLAGAYVPSVGSVDRQKHRFKDFIEQSGTITAHNPMGQIFSSVLNKQRNEKLRQDLEEEGLKFRKVQGSYNGNQEESFEIDGIDFEKLKELGKKYNQKSVVFGGKVRNIT